MHDWCGSTGTFVVGQRSMVVPQVAVSTWCCPLLPTSDNNHAVAMTTIGITCNAPSASLPRGGVLRRRGGLVGAAGCLRLLFIHLVTRRDSSFFCPGTRESSSSFCPDPQFQLYLALSNHCGVNLFDVIHLRDHVPDFQRVPGGDLAPAELVRPVEGAAREDLYHDEPSADVLDVHAQLVVVVHLPDRHLDRSGHPRVLGAAVVAHRFQVHRRFEHCLLLRMRFSHEVGVFFALP
mmetsp:Transcript_113338/g.321125  ORF Transcript_113338/g.321125 Transcript_113338/m.321125 type:complete len:235 (+) Transcript_113338:25-729(+)